MKVQKIEEGFRSTVEGLWSTELESSPRPEWARGPPQLVHARPPHFHDVSSMVPCSPGDNNCLGTDLSKYAYCWKIVLEE